MPRKPRINWNDPEILKTVEKLAANGMTDTQIATYFGVCRDTIAKTKRYNSTFSTAIKRGESRGIAIITNALFLSGKKGNLGAQIFYLKNKAGWKDRQEVDNTSSDGTMSVRTLGDFYNDQGDS